MFLQKKWRPYAICLAMVSEHRRRYFALRCAGYKSEVPTKIASAKLKTSREKNVYDKVRTSQKTRFREDKNFARKERFQKDKNFSQKAFCERAKTSRSEVGTWRNKCPQQGKNAKGSLSKAFPDSCGFSDFFRKARKV